MIRSKWIRLRCCSSDLTRAAQTAKSIYAGTIEFHPALREVPAPSFHRNLKIPFIGWAMLIRWSWLVNRQTRMNLKHAEARVKTFLDEIVFPPYSCPIVVSFI
ncbi:hypothetical protein [Paenibacillus naphthalenovorans]|uniref:hypothetical protein n=1 Tax=Paenibacillus naphthalenovorans TaxID=162209 RepID=UPI00088E0A33|nr:hypothetical protein [Paenibacillus naphthalenovorans]SDJ37025.1 hypothetical protein SAMN05421868_12518 [Paenibacillus naphthalenovorans]